MVLVHWNRSDKWEIFIYLLLPLRNTRLKTCLCFGFYGSGYQVLLISHKTLVVMTTSGMWDWYAKHRQGYAPIDTRLAVDCSPGNGGTHCVGGAGGNGSGTRCSGGGSGTNSGGGSSSLGWATPGSRRHFYNNHHHHHRYSYHQDGSMWGRSNGCSPGPVPGAHHQHPQQQAHPHRTLTPPPSLPSASSWGTLPSMHRSNTPNPSPWGSSSQISNGSAWNSGPTSGDCMLGLSSTLHLCLTVPRTSVLCQ